MPASAGTSPSRCSTASPRPCARGGRRDKAPAAGIRHNGRAMSDRLQQLAHLESLGDAVPFSEQIRALIPRSALLENFSPAEVRLLAHFMAVYRAEPGMEVIREGDGGDFMVVVIEGRVEVCKRDRWNTLQLIAAVDAGKTLGEMSMIDGEPRFATCVAVERS